MCQLLFLLLESYNIITLCLKIEDFEQHNSDHLERNLLLLLFFVLV